MKPVRMQSLGSEASKAWAIVATNYCAQFIQSILYLGPPQFCLWIWPTWPWRARETVSSQIQSWNTTEIEEIFAALTSTYTDETVTGPGGNGVSLMRSVGFGQTRGCESLKHGSRYLE